MLCLPIAWLVDPVCSVVRRATAALPAAHDPPPSLTPRCCGIHAALEVIVIVAIVINTITTAPLAPGGELLILQLTTVTTVAVAGVMLGV